MLTAEVGAARVRTFLTLFDQGLSSLSNFVLGIIVARAVSIEDYGVFALGYSAYGISLGVARAVGPDPLVVRFAGHADEHQRSESRRAVGASIVLGAALGAIAALIGVVVGGSVRPVMVAFGVGLPFLFAQDTYRYAFIMGKRPQLAVAIDVLWNVLFIATAWAASARGTQTPAPFVVLWVLGAGVAAVAAIAMSRALPLIGHGLRWMRTHRDLGARFAAEAIVSATGAHLVIYSTAIVAGLAAAGGLRGAHVLMGPVWIAVAGLVAASVPEGVRLKDRSLPALERRVYLLGAVLAVISVVWGVIAANLPDQVGTALLGDSWADSQPLMVVIGVLAAGTAATTGIVSGLRSLGAARRSFAASVPVGILVVVGGTIGAAVAGAHGALVGSAIPAWIGVGVLVVQFRRALGEAAAVRRRPVTPAAGA